MDEKESPQLAMPDPWDIYCQMTDEELDERDELLRAVAGEYGLGGP